jgi:excisionase family DNA binding protein
MENTTNDFLNFAEAKGYLKLSESRLRELVKDKAIEHYRFGAKLIRFKKEDLDAWVESQKVKAQLANVIVSKAAE